MLARIADDKDYAGRFVEVLGHLECGGEDRAGRAPAKDAFAAAELACHVK